MHHGYGAADRGIDHRHDRRRRHELIGMPTEAIVDLGIGFVPEGRRLFPRLSVTENLLMGAFRKKARPTIQQNLEFCLRCFLAWPNAGTSLPDP